MPRIFSLVLFVSLCDIHSGSAQEAIPVAVLNDIKAATVFVKVKSGELAGSGSGFLLRVEGDSAFLVTNEHVVSLRSHKPSGFEADWKDPTNKSKVEVVFNSGRTNERVLAAEIVAADAQRDLAVLRVKSFPDMPKAIEIDPKLELIETLQIYIFGFPFGQALSTNKGNPAITVGKGSISSVRQDAHGESKIIQIQGDVNPGNSGGPMVDSKGRLVGVTVAKLNGTQIGFAIATEELGKMLAGWGTRLSVRQKKIADNEIEVSVEVSFIDPSLKVEKASLLYLPTDSLKSVPKPDKEGRFDALPKANVLELIVKDQKATGSFIVKGDKFKRTEKYTLQPVYSTGERKSIYGMPSSPYAIDFSGNVREAVAGNRDIAPKRNAGGGMGAAADAKPIGEMQAKPISTGSGQTLACLCWTVDGRGFYSLDGKGAVRRIDLATFKESARFDIGKRCSWLSVTGEGVLVTVDEREAWLLGKEDLKVLTKMPIPRLIRAVGTPNSSLAVASVGDSRNSAGLTLIDLKSGKIEKEYKPSRFGNDLIGVHSPVVTPDGENLFCVTAMDKIARFKIDKSELSLEEIGPRIVQGSIENICVSHDGQLLCAPCSNGNSPLPGEERAAYSTYVFNANSLRKPELNLKSGAYPSAVGFDLPQGLIYAQNAQKQLIVLDRRGNKQKEFSLGGSSGAPKIATVKQILVHPEGRKLLVLGDTTAKGENPSVLWYVELP